MQIGTRIFEIIQHERRRQFSRFTKARQDLAELLSEYDLVQSAVLMSSPSATASSRPVPGFLAQAELVDLSSRGPDRMRSIERMAGSLAERSIQEAWENGEHLAYATSLILDQDRNGLELRSEIHKAINEYSDAQFRIQLIDRIALGLLNSVVDDNASDSETIKAIHSALEQT